MNSMSYPQVGPQGRTTYFASKGVYLLQDGLIVAEADWPEYMLGDPMSRTHWGREIEAKWLNDGTLPEGCYMPLEIQVGEDGRAIEELAELVEQVKAPKYDMVRVWAD
jgi:hypothetical protein